MTDIYLQAAAFSCVRTYQKGPAGGPGVLGPWTVPDRPHRRPERALRQFLRVLTR